MAESLVFSTEKALKDAGDKVSEGDKKDIEAKLEELKKVKDSEDVETIKKQTQELSTAAQKIGQAMYGSASSPQGQQQQQQAGQQAPGGEQPREDKKPEEGEVTEGEVEDSSSESSAKKETEEGKDNQQQ